MLQMRINPVCGHASSTSYRVPMTESILLRRDLPLFGAANTLYCHDRIFAQMFGNHFRIVLLFGIG
jgi:hypothetical protein